MMASPQINGTLLKSACYHEPFKIKIGNACCSSSDPRNTDRSNTLPDHITRTSWWISIRRSRSCAAASWNISNRTASYLQHGQKNLIRISFERARHILRWISSYVDQVAALQNLKNSYKFWSAIPYHENMKAWMFSSDTIVLPASGEGQ